MSRDEETRDGERVVVRSRRRWFVVVGLLVAIGCMMLLREWFLNLQDFARKASCRPNLIVATSERYAAENSGFYPPLSPTPGKLTFDTDACGEYCFSVSDYVCEFDRQGPSEDSLREVGNPDVIDDWSYVYLGYFIENEDQFLVFAETYRKTVGTGGRFEEDMDVLAGQGNCGGDKLYRLRRVDTIPDEIGCIREKASRIPVVIEWPENHRKPGGKVCFLDGHTEYMLYPGEFPMTEKVIEALRSLDALGKS